MEHRKKITEVGDVKVHNNAIKSITALTVSKIDGIVRLGESPFKSFLGKIGLNSAFFGDGIKVESSESGTKISINIIVKYGTDIAEIGSSVQDSVKQAVEDMTGITSVEVDVNVSGVEPK